MGERRALLIGAENTRFGEIGSVSKVIGELHKVVLDPSYGACRSALPGGRELLTGQQATRAAIVEALGDAVASAGCEQATLFVYFLGHGYEVDGDFYLVAADTPGEHVDSENAVLLSQRIKELVRQYPNVDGLMLVIDACYSGAAIPALYAGLASQRARVEFFMSARSGDRAFRGCFSRSLIRLLERGSSATADTWLRASDESNRLRLVAPTGCKDLTPPKHSAMDAPYDAALWLGHNVAADVRPALAGTRSAATVALLTREWQRRPDPAMKITQLLYDGISPIAITGGPGTGKSALLASFARISVSGQYAGLDTWVTTRPGDSLADLAGPLRKQLSKSSAYSAAVGRFEADTPVYRRNQQLPFERHVTGPIEYLDPEDERIVIGIDAVDQLDSLQQGQLFEAFTNLHGAALIVTGRSVDLPDASQVHLPDQDPEGVRRLVKALVKEPDDRTRIADLSEGEWLRARMLIGLHRAGHLSDTRLHLPAVFEEAVTAAMNAAPQAPVESMARVLAAAPVGAWMPLEALAAALQAEEPPLLNVIRDGVVALGELLARDDPGSSHERVGAGA